MSDERFLNDEIEALLRTPAMWDEPSEAVSKAIQQGMAEATPGGTSRSPIRWLAGAAAAAVAVVVAIVITTRPPAPDWTVALAAPADSAITGEVSGWNEPTGTRVVLEIDNLDPALEGTFYEVWWVDLDTGGAVSSGSFLEEDSVEMWMGIRRGEFPKMLITVEATDGDPNRSDNVIAWSDD